MDSSHKALIITGKHNKYQMNKLLSNETDEKSPAKREKMNHVSDEQCGRHHEQLVMINMCYADEPFEMKPTLIRELENKISGYKAQDIKKNIYDTTAIITFPQLLEKLVASKLRCCYCCHEVKVLYKMVRDMAQWTLDRKDNDLCHSSANTVIACLKCNLQRRVTEEEKFMFTKKLKVMKL